ncbi:recombinase family protein [Rhodococcus koreensis]|uniref:recombinase family protein n=1 Tax=Rhodococcus koreensis TaxID=99653 RepID=UPI0036DCA268
MPRGVEPGEDWFPAQQQIDALANAGVDPANINVDKNSGATTERPGLQTLLGYARTGDVIVAHPRPARTDRSCLQKRLSHRPPP